MNAKILKVTAFIFAPFFFSFDTTLDGPKPGVRKSARALNTNYYSEISTLSKALTFHASFNHGPDADFGNGDKKIYTGDFKGSRQQNEMPTTAGLGTPPLVIAKDKGKYGDALAFTKDNSHVVFYKLEKNIQYSESDFKGSVSLWMSFNPSDIPNQYCDPMQLTDKYYASDAIWIDITKNDVP